jgi:hypothetical protein
VTLSIESRAMCAACGTEVRGQHPCPPQPSNLELFLRGVLRRQLIERLANERRARR